MGNECGLVRASRGDVSDIPLPLYQVDRGTHGSLKYGSVRVLIFNREKYESQIII